MNGWRDSDGRTASERRDAQRADERARLAETVRNRPLSLLKPLLGTLFVGVLVFALVSALW